jgi:hypothetical protein
MDIRKHTWKWGWLFFGCFSWATGVADQWPEKDFNPKPLAGDFYLPLPCDGQMVFRRIEVPVDGVLGDRRIMIGGTEEQVLEGQRFEFISGGFTGENHESTRYYYIGKYEVTIAQYRAFSGKCDSRPPDRRLPATGVNWHDAVEFARLYTEWLLKTHSYRLPKEDGQPGYLRLPTEGEWEYAARGGIAVSEAEFQAKTFPLSGKLSEYAWFRGTRSSHGELQFVGLLKPNPLGLFDVLGNVDEIVLESFRANRYGRLHGLSGGYIIKGGNYQTAEKRIRTSARQEQWHYDQGQARRSPTVGFRIVLSTPVITSKQRLKALNQEWDRLSMEGRMRRAGDLSVKEGDLMRELGVLEEQLTLVNQKNQLDTVATLLKGNIAERNAQRDRAAKSMLRLGAFLGQKIYYDYLVLKKKSEVLSLFQQIGSGKQVEAKKGLAAARSAMEENIAYFQDMVVTVAQEYTPDVIDAQLDTLQAEFEKRGRGALTDYASRFGGCVKTFNSDGELELQRCFYGPLAIDRSQM